MIEKIFGQILREARNEVGVTQEFLAAKSDLDRTYISMLERGLRTPTIDTLFKIASALKKKPSELIEYLEKKLNENRI